MKFHLLKQGFQGVEVPKVIFENLNEAREYDLKVALYILQQSCINPVEISVKLNITLASVNSSLLFWCDKGLLLYEDETPDSRPKKRPHLSAREIVQMSAAVPEIGILASQLQNIFGYAINEKYTNRFIELFVQENIPVDLILTVSMFFVKSGQDNPAYILKAISTWHTKLGITNGLMAEEYIALCNKRMKRYESIAPLFKQEASKFNSSEKTLIDSWFEKLNMNEEMIACAIERAGALASIKYCNGILKAWSNKGYFTPQDLASQAANTTIANEKNIDKLDDIVLKGLATVPVFHKGE